MLRKIRRLGLGTMTILSRNRVVEIAYRVNISFLLQLLHQLVFHPPRISMTRRVEHQALNLREVFQAPRKEGCFGCGQSGHRLRDYPPRHGQRSGNGVARSTTSSAPTSLSTLENVVVSTITCCMLFRISKLGKVHLM